MAFVGFPRNSGRGLLFSVAVLATIGMAAAPRPAHAVSPGAAVGIGVGAFALGSVLANPYYSPYYAAPYGYYPPAPAYYPPAPYYQAPRSCWDPYYRRYYAC
jgi:hypothetical protein